MKTVIVAKISKFITQTEDDGQTKDDEPSNIKTAVVRTRNDFRAEENFQDFKRKF